MQKFIIILVRFSFHIPQMKLVMLHTFLRNVFYRWIQNVLSLFYKTKLKTIKYHHVFKIIIPMRTNGSQQSCMKFVFKFVFLVSRFTTTEYMNVMDIDVWYTNLNNLPSRVEPRKHISILVMEPINCDFSHRWSDM